MTSHFLAFENLTGIFTHTDRTGGTMSFRHTMTSILHSEVPSLDHTLITFTFRSCFNINELANLKVSWAQAITNGQQVFRTDAELGKLSFRWQIVLHQMTNLGLSHFLSRLFANANLNRVNAIFVFTFDLSHLASIYLNNSTLL